jgi:hypothetical protein
VPHPKILGSLKVQNQRGLNITKCNENNLVQIYTLRTKRNSIEPTFTTTHSRKSRVAAARLGALRFYIACKSLDPITVLLRWRAVGFLREVLGRPQTSRRFGGLAGTGFTRCKFISVHRPPTFVAFPSEQVCDVLPAYTARSAERDRQ